MTLLLRAQGLTLTYPGGTRAVRGLDLELRAGDLLGLIGPDGAGKSSVFRMLVRLLRPTAGRLEHPLGARGIGYVPQSFSLAPDLSVEENLRLQAGLFGLQAPETRMGELLESVGLASFRARPAGALSGGMKQKLSLCSALLPSPALLLLDEPTTGVDPVSRREFWDLLHGVHEEGVAILFSTPYMDEAEYAHRVMFMEAGRILDSGTLEELRSRLPGLMVRMMARDRETAMARLREFSPLEAFGEGEELRVRFPDQDPDALLSRLASCPELKHPRLCPISLEDVFLHLLGQGEGVHA
ncbi:MAG: ABC transporter ATP-binding protein [Acidobacteria bacterium]|nr:ABC transporter ATP-binding protein [Acidobacteriota bacterium]